MVCNIKRLNCNNYSPIKRLNCNIYSPIIFNVVFSPLSIHAALAILTSGATDNSATQRELLNALGRSNNIQALENFYHNIFSDLRNNVVSANIP